MNKTLFTVGLGLLHNLTPLGKGSHVLFVGQCYSTAEFGRTYLSESNKISRVGILDEGCVQKNGKRKGSYMYPHKAKHHHPTLKMSGKGPLKAVSNRRTLIMTHLDGQSSYHIRWEVAKLMLLPHLGKWAQAPWAKKPAAWCGATE